MKSIKREREVKTKWEEQLGGGFSVMFNKSGGFGSHKFVRL